MIDIETLHALADGELTHEERTAVEATLAQDPRAARELAAIRATKQALASSARPVECAEEWRRCVKRFDELDRSKRTEAFMGRYAWALCCGLFAMIIGAGLLQRGGGEGRIGARDLAQMSASVSSVQIPDNVEGWLGRLFGKSPAISQESVRVTGGRQGVHNGRPYAQLNLEDSNGKLALLVMPGAVAVDGAVPLDSRHISGEFGHANYVAWADNGLFLMLVGEREPTELRSVAQRIPVSARSR